MIFLMIQKLQIINSFRSSLRYNDINLVINPSITNRFERMDETNSKIGLKYLINRCGWYAHRGNVGPK